MRLADLSDVVCHLERVSRRQERIPGIFDLHDLTGERDVGSLFFPRDHKR